MSPGDSNERSDEQRRAAAQRARSLGGTSEITISQPRALLASFEICGRCGVGWMVSHLMMGVVYFAVVTPMGLLSRLVRGDTLHRSPQKLAHRIRYPECGSPQARAVGG